MKDHFPWEAAPHLPWSHFTSPLEQWQVLPSFVFGEYMYFAATLAALVHAYRSGRGYLLVWLAALIAGTANDLIFMALPLVDNFWQAQATVMLTPRLPLYIPCVYVCFLYYPTVAARRAGLGPWSTAALAGLIGCLYYAPYDIVGAKFLWWTWHDTDQPIARRILGAPVSSSLWVLTFVSSFAWLVGRALGDAVDVSASTFAKGFALVAGLTTALMMVQITIVQQLDGGAPGYIAFATTIALYAAVVWRDRGALGSVARPRDGLAQAVVTAHFATFVLILAVFSPETHRSTGVHQLPGECYVETTDLTGFTRHQHLCVTDFDEDYSFACAAPPGDGAEWYTVCGRPHSSFAAWMFGVVLLAAAGIAVFRTLFGDSLTWRAGGISIRSDDQNRSPSVHPV